MHSWHYSDSTLLRCAAPVSLVSMYRFVRVQEEQFMRLLILAVSVLFALVMSAAPLAAQPKRQWTPREMMEVQRIGGVQVSPDGKRVVYAARQALLDGGRSEYLTHLYLVNADG